MKKSLLMFFSLAAYACSVSVSAKTPRKPNIILILSDDQGWGSTSVKMDRNIPESSSDYMLTPNLEKLAQSGMVFSNGCSGHPNCSPSRAAIQTGKTPARLHLTDIIERRGESAKTGTKLITPRNATGLDENEYTVAELIKKYRPEYSTAHFGKWHLGAGGPENHGYDISDGATRNNEGNQKYYDNPKDIYGITTRGTQWMTEQVKDQTPFFLMLAHYATHLGIEYKDSTLLKMQSIQAGVRHNNAEYAAMTKDLDTGIGLIMQKVEELGIKDNTYIIDLSDNGAFPFLNPENTNGPVKGWKATLFEGGIRVPFIVCGPGISAGSHCDERVAGWDLFPTVCDILEISEVPDDIDGGSLLPLLANKGRGSVLRNNDFMVFHWPRYVVGKGGLPSSAIYYGDYKLIMFYETNELRLYNINNDITETKILNDVFPEKLTEMQQLLNAYLAKVNAGFPVLNPEYNPDNDPAKKHIDVINKLMY